MKLFFRDDDMGWDNAKFQRLVTLFNKHNTKLNVAAIPLSCLEIYRKKAFQKFSHVLQFHTHGYGHFNHEKEGVQRGEYGAGRPLDIVAKEFAFGKQSLEELFEDLYFPAFAPPWHIIQDEHIPLLEKTGFKILSRNHKKQRQTFFIQELDINISLHPKVKKNYPDLMQVYHQTCSLGMQQPTVGIMLHHTFMEDLDYLFLDKFLPLLRQENLNSQFFSEIYNPTGPT